MIAQIECDGSVASWSRTALTRYEPTYLVVDSDLLVVRGAEGPFAPQIGAAWARPGASLSEILPPPLREPFRRAVAMAATTGLGRVASVPLPLPARAALTVDLTAELMGGPAGRIHFLIVLQRHAEDAGAPALCEPPAGGSDHERPDRPGGAHGADIPRAGRADRAAGYRDRRSGARGAMVGDQLEGVPIPTLMLDRALRISRFAPGLATLFRIRRRDIGRPIADLHTSLDFPALEAALVAVLATDAEIEREFATRETPARVFLMRARPLRRAGDLEEGVVITFVEITERKRIEDRLRFLAHHDQLTGLANRVALHEFLGRERDAGPELPGALLLLDLDGFKQVNDVHGHPAGDRLLVLVGERLRARIGVTDFVCRLGGDEFAVARSRATGRASVERFARALIEAISEPYRVDDRTIEIGLSVGVAFDDRAADPDTLLRAADTALYAAKSEGGGTFRVFDPETQRRQRARNALSLDLVGAAGRGEFELHYQPQIRLPDRAVVGAEALIRWRHPAHGLLPPSAFVPIAEETGRITELGAWAIATACRAAASWTAPLRVSVNVSARHLQGRDLGRVVRAALDASGLDPTRLILELTESRAIENRRQSRETLADLRRLGVGISVDDFGSGYASFSYLHGFEVDQVKIDASFVSTLETRQSALIVAAVVAVADVIGVRVCAEGVETEATAEALARLGVDELQGFLFSPPVPADALSATLARLREAMPLA